MSDSTQSGGGIGFLGLLGVLFIGLKLTGYIDWSWWWVTAPLWGGIALALAILAVVAVVAGLALAFTGIAAWLLERSGR